jgi:hypothetical protein
MLKRSPDNLYVLWSRYLKGQSKLWSPTRKRMAKGLPLNTVVGQRLHFRKHNRIDTWALRICPYGTDPNQAK